MSAQHKTLVLESKAGPLFVHSVAKPVPRAGEVLVKIESAALNPVDWKMQAVGPSTQKYPAVLGTDASGTIVEVGEGVTDRAVGDRV